MAEITINELKEKLSKGKLTFQYTKLNNVKRTATGTTDLELVPEDQRPTGKTPGPNNCIAYYDLDLARWRSVSITSKISI